MFEPPSPLSTTLPDFSSDDVHEEAPEDPMSPRKPPVVPSFLSVDSSDAEKARAYANLALALNSTIPTILENQEVQQGMILAYSGKVDLLNGKVDAVHELITKTLAAEAKAVARGRTIAAMPSMPPPPQVLELDEEPTNHGQRATVKISDLERPRAIFPGRPGQARGPCCREDPPGGKGAGPKAAHGHIHGMGDRCRARDYDPLLVLRAFGSQAIGHLDSTSS